MKHYYIFYRIIYKKKNYKYWIFYLKKIFILSFHSYILDFYITDIQNRNIPIEFEKIDIQKYLLSIPKWQTAVIPKRYLHVLIRKKKTEFGDKKSYHLHTL